MPDKNEIRIRLDLGALMGHLGPKGGTQGGAQGSPPKGLYKQGRGPKTAHLRGYINNTMLLLPIRVDTLEVLHLLHKDEPHVRRFTQLHCRLPSALHRRATEVPQPRV